MIRHSEGECNDSIIFWDKAGWCAISSKLFIQRRFQVYCSVKFSNQFQWHIHHLIVTSIFGRSTRSLLNNNFQLVVKLILIIITEGARAPLSKLVVGCGNSKISFHFCKDSRIFRGGVKDSTIGIVSNNGIDGRIMAFGCLLLAVGLLMPLAANWLLAALWPSAATWPSAASWPLA